MMKLIDLCSIQKKNQYEQAELFVNVFIVYCLSRFE